MHIGSKISFKETININNVNFINLLNCDGIEIYNKVLDMIDNELADSNIKILNDLENNLITGQFFLSQYLPRFILRLFSLPSAYPTLKLS